jgi:lambda family phage portal protein
MSVVDKIIGRISPSWAVTRMRNKMVLGLYEGTRKYEAASKAKRAENWISVTSSAIVESRSALSILKGRSRELFRNNPFHKRAIEAIKTNVIGTGIVPTPSNLSDTQDKIVRDLWKRWAGKKGCDFTGKDTFFGLQNLVMKAVAESGECIIRKRTVNDKKFPLQLQVQEGDVIDSSKDQTVSDTGNEIVQGIEFDKKGKVVAYWLFDKHPDDTFDHVSRRIPAEFVIHVFWRDRPEQLRGIPFGVAAFTRLFDLDGYQDAELMRQKVAACFTAFVHDASPQPVEADTADLDYDKMQPGRIEELPVGRTVTFSSPPTTQNYDPYTRAVLRSIAVGYGVTYEVMTGDYSNVNFSSGRMGWIEMHRYINELQWRMFIPQFCDDVWQWFCEAMNLMNGTPAEIDVDWTTPRREMIDPVKETKALSEMVRNGFMSWQEVVRELGYDPRETLKQLAADKTSFDEEGLELTCDGRFDAGKSDEGSTVGPKANAPKKQIKPVN